MGFNHRQAGFKTIQKSPIKSGIKTKEWQQYADVN